MFVSKKSFTAPITPAVLLICCALISAFGQASRCGQAGAKPSSLDATGHYTFTGQRSLPMRDFNSINLIVGGQKREQLSGDVTLNRSERGLVVYKLIPTQLTGEKLTFKTQIINGINYRFEGKISRNRLPESEGGYDVPLLEGTLRKFRRGQQIGVLQGGFKYEEFAD